MYRRIFLALHELLIDEFLNMFCLQENAKKKNQVKANFLVVL